MKNSVDLAPVLSFLKHLENDNDRAWFEANRAEYETALARFEDFVAVRARRALAIPDAKRHPVALR